MPRFIKWDFDHNVAIEYERLGECNNCGECCIEIVKYRHIGELTEGPAGIMGNRIKPEGVWSEYSEGDKRRFAGLPRKTGERKPCEFLVNGHCAIHANKSMDENTMCWAWPIIPEHVEMLPQCSYTFREINRWQIIPTQKDQYTEQDFKVAQGS